MQMSKVMKTHFWNVLQVMTMLIQYVKKKMTMLLNKLLESYKAESDSESNTEEINDMPILSMSLKNYQG